MEAKPLIFIDLFFAVDEQLPQLLNRRLALLGVLRLGLSAEGLCHIHLAFFDVLFIVVLLADTQVGLELILW